MASITLLFPLPLGPTTAEKLCNKNLPKFQLHKLNDSNKWKNPINNLMKWANALFASVRFEVPHHHLFDEKPRWWLWFHWCGRVRFVWEFSFLFFSAVTLNWIVVMKIDRVWEKVIISKWKWKSAMNRGFKFWFWMYIYYRSSWVTSPSPFEASNYFYLIQ